MNENTVRTITIRGQSEGLDKLTADVNKLATAQQNVAVVSEQTGKRILSLEDAWKRQTMRLDEAARAQANIARETKVADAALREGLATQAQHAQRLEQINQRYTKTADATKVVAHQTGLARHELVNLGRQAQDVGVSLMSGQSPFTVLVQQGAQIADVFATSGGTLRGFFGQAAGWAKTFLTSTTGIVTAVLAVGAAAIYVAAQFRTASTTIEEALEEQNRLLKEGKTLLDAKATAEQKAFAQSKELTQFQAGRNLRDIQGKLGSAMEGAAIAARGRSTRPTQVGGEMGEAPTGVAALGPGYDRIAEAVEKLNAAMAAGQPGLAAFRDELAKVGMAHPEIAQTAEEMIKLAQQGISLEQAAFKLEAMRAALAGVATNAQLAAIGFASIAQFNLANLGAEQAAAATERMAQYTQAIAASYPGMSIEVAKQLNAMQGQLTVAQARTGAEKMVAQEYATQNRLLAEGKALEEAAAIAAMERAIAEANVSTAISEQIHSLEQQTELSKARIDGTEATVKAEQAYVNALRDGASEEDAAALKAATLNNERQRENEQQQRALVNIGDQIQKNTTYSWKFVGSLADWQHHLKIAESLIEGITNRLDLLPTQFGETAGGSRGYVTDLDPHNAQVLLKQMQEQYGAGNVEMATHGYGWGEYQLPRLTQSYIDQQNAAALEAHAAGYDVSSPAAIQKSFENALSVYGAKDMGVLNRLIEVAQPDQQASLIQQAISQVLRSEPAGLAREEMIQTLNDKLEGLTKSTDSLNSTMQNALSPYYSQDPRTTKLGFRAGVTGNPDWMTGATNANPLVAILGQGATAPGMADGGSFTVGGGYSANDNRMAVFPVASGEEVVVNRNKGGRGTQMVNIDNRIIINGSLDADAMSKLKISRFQQSQRMRAGLARA